MTTSYVLGVDPGLASTGWGLVRVDGSRVSHVAHGCLRTSPDDPEALRVGFLASGLRDVLRVYPYVRVVAVERWAHYRANEAGSDAHMKLGLAIGAALAACALQGVGVEQSNDAQGWRRAIGLGRSATKAEAQERVRMVLGLREVVRPVHASDALGVALAAGGALRSGVG